MLFYQRLVILSLVLSFQLHAATVCIANASSNSVSLLDSDTNQIQSNVPSGSTPRGIATTPDNSQLYITNYGGNTVTVLGTYDPTSFSQDFLIPTLNSLISTITVGTNPIAVAITPNGALAFVVNEGSGSVSVIETTSVTTGNNNANVTPVSVGTSPIAIAISPDGTKACVTNSGSNNVTIINIADLSTTTVSLGGGSSPNQVAITQDSSTAYVSDTTNSILYKINLNSPSSSIISGFDGPTGAVLVTPGGTNVFTTLPSVNEVAVVSVATDAILGSPSVGINPISLAVTPNGSRVYVLCQGSTSLYYLNAGVNTVAQRLDFNYQLPSLTRAELLSIGIGQDGIYLYIGAQVELLERMKIRQVDRANGVVYIVDLQSGTTVKTVGVGDYPSTISVPKLDAQAIAINQLNRAAVNLTISTGGVKGLIKPSLGIQSANSITTQILRFLQ